MEATREIQRRNELDKEGTLIKDNLKGTIHRGAKTGKQESSDEERKRERKAPGRRSQERRQYAPTGPERIASDQELCDFEKNHEM